MGEPTDWAIERRGFMKSAAAAALAASAGGVASAATKGKKMIVTGPIPYTASSKPYGTAMVEGTAQYRLLQQYDYVEEEFFAAGSANVYGPGVNSGSIKSGLDFEAVKALSKPVRFDVPYRTRLLVVRPRDMAKFSGNAHVIAFHNLGAGSSVESHLLRNGDIWVGVEVSNGTKFGPQETLSGGVAHLHKFDAARYAELSLPGGMPEDWPDLTPGNLGRTSAQLNFMDRASYPMSVFLQEIHRGYAQGPDIVSQLVHLLKQGGSASPLKARVQKTFSYGASGGTTFLTPYVEYHHDNAMLPDGRPPFDGYLIMVGREPANRPKGAVTVFLNSEAEALQHPLPLPENTDSPRFRYYEIPSTGHGISAPVEQTSSSERSSTAAHMADVLPGGVAGLTDRGEANEYAAYDKINAPIIWGIWANMYDWIYRGKPMPIAAPITRDASTPGGLARDEHGNAKGGLRTPWVDVPEATYVARMSAKNPLSAGVKHFDEAKIKSLYGDRASYTRACEARVEKMAADGWIRPVDVALMKTSCR